MVRLPMAFFFSASRSKNRSSLALSSVWAKPVVNKKSVSKVANNILIFIKASLLLDVYGDGMSDVSEQRGKEDYDHHRPRAEDRQVIRLPFFEGGERSAPSQEADVEY